MFKLFLLILLSFGAILLSWHSLHDPRSHGFYRFFAFECIIAITLLNIDLWFIDPTSSLHLLSWLLLSLSIVLVLPAFYLLRKYGVPQGGVDETTKFVDRGIYKYIRHPLYASLGFFTWGVFFKDPSILAGFLGIGATIFLLITAKFEEILSLDKFGDEYAEYMKGTKMLLPFLI